MKLLKNQRISAKIFNMKKRKLIILAIAIIAAALLLEGYILKYVNDKNKPLADYIDIASIEQMTDESTPLTDLIVKEQAEKIESVMRDKLTKGEFDVMSLFVSGYRYDDICRMTGRSYKSVDGALQRARKKLAEALKND